MVLRINGMLLSNFKRNWDAIPPHLKPWLLVFFADNLLFHQHMLAKTGRNKFLSFCHLLLVVILPPASSVRPRSYRLQCMRFVKSIFVRNIKNALEKPPTVEL
jgi:hypothetical protein